MNLSPLNRAGLHLTQLIESDTGRPIEEKHQGPCVVTAWECGECGDLHRYQEDAFDCCAPAPLKGLHDQDVVVLCPICRSGHSEHRLAVDCCLWKDLDAPTRWRIADAVEAGSTTWAEALS